MPSFHRFSFLFFAAALTFTSASFADSPSAADQLDVACVRGDSPAQTGAFSGTLNIAGTAGSKELFGPIQLGTASDTIRHTLAFYLTTTSAVIVMGVIDLAKQGSSVTKWTFEEMWDKSPTNQLTFQLAGPEKWSCNARPHRTQ